MKTTPTPPRYGRSAIWAILGFLFLSLEAFSQLPVVTVRLANPSYDCETNRYCLDVEFMADQPGLMVFGVNVRFFYDDDVLEFLEFTDYQASYGDFPPSPPQIITNGPAGPALFNLAGPAEFVNGAVQLADTMNGIVLSTVTWTKLFQICFNVDDPGMDPSNFCPSVIWDLEEDPANGGYLSGDDGVVITVVSSMPGVESDPVTENVVQFNWMYSGGGASPPFGMPVETVCRSVDCSPMLMCAADITIECDVAPDVTITGVATATDICAGDITISYSDMTMSGGCPAEYTITRTWIAINDCDLADTCLQTISIADTRGPAVTCPMDITVQCTSQIPAPNPGLVTATDNCVGQITYAHERDSISNQTCLNRYLLHRIYSATDECGNESTCIQRITVNDQTPPMITCPANITVSCINQVPGPNINLVTATDNCGGPVTITFVGDQIIGGMACTNRFTLTRTYRATDACGNSATCVQSIRVDDQTPPTIVCPADVTVTCSSNVPSPNTAAVVRSDNCSGGVTVIHMSDLIINQVCAHRYTIWRRYQATDVCGNTATCMQSIVVNDIVPPSITCPADITVTCPADVPAPNPAEASGSDNCSGTPVITHVGDVNIEVECDQRYTVQRTYRATDACGNSSTCIQLIRVRDFVPPTITCPDDITVTCAEDIPAPEPDDVTVNENTCGGLVTINHVLDVVTDSTCAHGYTVQRFYEASDPCGNSTQCVQLIRVQDETSPALTCPDDITVECPNDVPAPDPMLVTATDNCMGDVTISYFDESITNVICDQQYTIVRIYQAEDDCGNESTCSQLIYVRDLTPPDITCAPDVTTSDETLIDPQFTGTASATDNCGGEVTLDYSDVTIEGLCASNFTIERTWIATDNCGNSSTCTQIIRVLGECFLDLALVKTLGPGQDTIRPGDDIDFIIRIDNEGETTVSGVTITDYIPIGFTLNDPDWTAGTEGSTGMSASIYLSISNGGLPAGGFMPGDFLEVEITLQANLDVTSGVHINVAEISSIEDPEGNEIGFLEADSNPDDDDTNDPPGEDDIDPEPFCIYIEPGIEGDIRVCSGDAEVYVARPYDPTHTYTWMVSDPDVMIVDGTDSSITVVFNVPSGTIVSIKLIDQVGMCMAMDSILVMVQDAEPMACIDHFNLSLDNECGTIITGNVILAGEDPGDDVYEVFVIDMNGDTVPGGLLTWEHVGQTFKVSVCNVCTGQCCWGWVTVEDKLPPRLDCICPVNNEDRMCDITCLDIERFLAGDIPENLRPIVMDNCSDPELIITNIELDYNNCESGNIKVTWQATDHVGNVGTCMQQFNIIPLNLGTLQFPGEYNGECGGSSDPSVTGWPQILGQDITNIPGHCNIIATYTDQVINLCGGGRKIIRRWRVFDWCVPTEVINFQTIWLRDQTGPQLVCPPDVTVSTSLWLCEALVTVPQPQANDACSDIKSYQLVSPLGVVFPQGGQYRVTLPVGTHELIWTVTDECHNSSTCSSFVTVRDGNPPAVACHQHTVVSLTTERPNGVTLVPAEAFDDGSRDNCSPVTFRARRMDSCIDFDWTTGGACVDDTPGGVPAVNGFDAGTEFGPCVPFACCDLTGEPVMVMLEVSDEAGNVNYCMVSVNVQDKLGPSITCPPSIQVSCEFLFEPVAGTYSDADGNNDGSLDEDPLSEIFGNVYDAFRFTPDARQPIVIHDPFNDQQQPQPYTWGLDGWASDNCSVELSVVVTETEDCSGQGLPGNAPEGAVKLIQRHFIAFDGTNTATCTQWIWVVNFDPFYIADQTSNNEDPNDGVIWPADVTISDCGQDLSGAGEPIIIEGPCSVIGVDSEDTHYQIVEDACFKILREWRIIDWCQYNPNTGYGIWYYTQAIKVIDQDGPEFLNCPSGPVELCTNSPGVSLLDNNQVFLGEGAPGATSCSAHLNITQTVEELCSGIVKYDVKVYPFNGPDFILIHPETEVEVGANDEAVLTLNTENSINAFIQENGLPYTEAGCDSYHRVLWTVEDGCGNRRFCDYLMRLTDCKAPSAVCLSGVSTVNMEPNGEVTLFAEAFDASSVDDCTPSAELLFSFSGTAYAPSMVFDCDNVPVLGVPFDITIWVADGGSDDNCDDVIQWNERNMSSCVSTLLIQDNGVCGPTGNILAGEIMTPEAEAVGLVMVHLNTPTGEVPGYMTEESGTYSFDHVAAQVPYTIRPERLDEPRNGVSTLDLVKIQRHLLGQEPFTTPYAYVAADANGNGSVSAIDLIEIRKLILGLYDEFPSNTSWRFVREGSLQGVGQPWMLEESITINPVQGEHLTDLDFVGIKIGDVNQTAKAHLQDIESRGANRLLTVVASPVDPQRKDGLVRVKFTLPELVSGFQWTLHHEGLEWVGIQSQDIPIDESNVGQPMAEVLTLSWNGEVLDEMNYHSTISFELLFRATTVFDWHEAIRMSGEVTGAEAYTPGDEVMDLSLRLDLNGSQPEFSLYQNLPNPWRDQTLIGFDLPADAPATITIYDGAGKTVHVIRGEYKAGYNSELVRLPEVPASGILYYRLESGEYAATRRMTLMQ